MTDRARLPVISLFSGAMGLDLGLEQAGFEIRVAVECNPIAVQTIRRNRPKLPVIPRKIEDVTTEEILSAAGLEKEQAVLVAGGPSCQAFSTAGKRGSMGDPRGNLFQHFLRVVNEARPSFFVMENVRGLLSAAVKHRPLAERGPGFPVLSPDEELGSAFVKILQELKDTEYYTVFDVLNAADYGVPQTRERVVFLGSRDGVALEMPIPTHLKGPSDHTSAWATLKDALDDLQDPSPEYKYFPPAWREYLKLVPEGGNWTDLPKEKQEEALGAAYKSWGGRVGFYRRLSWKKPAPALTTCPESKGTMQCHPDEVRTLSIREYARIQQFPDDWQIEGSIAQKYLQLGNAVPVGLAKAIGGAILLAMNNNKRIEPVSQISCPNEGLRKRIAKRPKTQLNPPRMLKTQDPAEIRKWRESCNGYRTDIVEFLDRSSAPCTSELASDST